jgi:hypothetical protein
LEAVGVSRPLGVLSNGQIVEVQRGAVGQVPRAEERRRGRILDGLVCLGELEDDRFGMAGRLTVGRNNEANRQIAFRFPLAEMSSR